MNMRRSKKSKALAFLLSLAMLITMFPSGMFAAPGDSGSNVTSGQTNSPVKVQNSDSNVSITKEATRIDADSWNVKMTVQATQKIEPAPLDVVLVLDVSNSMKEWVPDSGGQTRMEVVKEAARNLVDDLSEMGNVNLGLVEFHGVADEKKALTSLNTDQNVNNMKQTIDQLTPDDGFGYDAGTNITEGLRQAQETLGNSSQNNSNKVIIFLSDGEYNEGGDPSDVANRIKNNGTKIYTVGFATREGTETLQTICSQPSQDYYFYAGNLEDLTDAFTEIAYEITAMINDSLGDDVKIDGDVKATINGGTSSNIHKDGDSHFWWNSPEQGLSPGDVVTLEFQVSLVDDAETLWENNGGANAVVTLNDSARVNYQVGSHGKFQSLKLPALKDNVELAKLSVDNAVNGVIQENDHYSDQYTIVYDGNAVDNFTWVAPSRSNNTYDHSEYVEPDAAGVSVTDNDFPKNVTAPGEYQLIHYYTNYDQEILNAIGKVTVDCVTRDDHKDAKYDVLKDSIVEYRVEEGGFMEADTATVKISADAYVDLFDQSTKTEHELVSTSPVTVKLEYKWQGLGHGYDWEVVSGAPVVFKVKCEVPASITGITKTVVATDQDKAAAQKAGVDIQHGGYTFPETTPVPVVIEENGSVKLLYKITVKGTNTDFTVKESNDATLVGDYEGITQDQDGIIHGKIAADETSVTFYVEKSYTNIPVGKTSLDNTVTVYMDDQEKGRDTEEVPIEVTPDGPTADELNDLLNVKLECTNVDNEHDYDTKDYADLLGDSYSVSDVTKDNGQYVVTVTVNADKYVSDYSGEKVTGTAHELDGDNSKTVNLKWDNGWMLADGAAATVIFKVKCTTPSSISDFDKALVTSADDVPKGLNAEDYDFPDENSKIAVDKGDSVSLLYKLTFTGKNAKFVVDDKDATLVQASDESFEQKDGLITGYIKNGTVTLWVTRTWENIQADQKLSNTASVYLEGDSENPDEDTSEEVEVVVNNYDLIYDANGGQYADDAKVDGVTFSEDHKTATESDLQKGDHDLNTEIAEELATRQTSDGIDVIFVGWTEDDAVKDKVYDKDAENVPKTTDKVMIDSEGERVYALWAEDANGNDVPDYQEDQYTLTYNANGGSLTDNLDEKVEKASVDGLLPNTDAMPNYPLWDKEGESYIGTIPSEVKGQWPSHDPEDGETVIFIGWTAEADSTIYSKNNKDDFAKVTLLDDVVLDAETMSDSTEKNVYAVWGYDEDGDGIPDVQEDQYSLTYHSTSGYFGDKDTITAPVTGLLEDKDYPLWSKDEKGQESGTAPEGYTWPTHDQAPAPEDSVIADEGTNVNVAFIGWTETNYTESYDDGLDHIFAAGEDYPEVTSTTHIPPNDTDMNRDVYAVWGYDENGDGIADAQQIVIVPADITIYEGGNGYEGVVEDGEENVVAGEDGADNGLPEPGYYLILPAALDEELGGQGNTEDLSNQLRLEYDFEGDHRAWTLDLYNNHDEEGVTAEDNKVTIDRNHDGDTDDENDFYYVYQLIPDDPERPVRLEFKVDTSDGAEYITDDQIDFGLENLYEKYPMRLYNTEDFNRGAVVAQIDPDGDGTWTDVSTDIVHGIARGFGELTIRGTNIEDPVANVAGTTEALDFEDNNKVAAKLTSDDTTYFVNGSTVPVVNQDAVSFLADNITEESETASALKDAAVEKAEADDSLNFDSSYNFDFSYLDLVDTSNGNAYVTTDKPVEVYWQYPEGMGKDDEFYVVHYDGLDREFDADNLESMLTDENVKVYSADAAEDSGLQLERTDDGIMITTSTFSPFALVYKEKPSVTPDPGPGGGGDPDRPGLNLEDHYSYIVGYPEDYRTGEATDDESLWPVKPQGKITRAEVATIFYRLLNNETRTENWTTSNNFTDVDADDWYNTPISTLSSMGIIVGYNDGSFQPNAPITRAEFAAIAVRFYQNNDVNYEQGLFTDIDGSEWFADAIAAAYEHGIIGGYVDGSFQPNNQITRAEAAAIVNRTTDRFPDKDHLLDAAEMRTWPDNADPDAWYYADIQEATNSHEYYKMDDPDGEEGDQIEQWTERGEDVDWDAVEAYQESVH